MQTFRTGAGTRRSANGRAHLKCASCGYDLFSLSTEGECPECGHRICDSIAEAKRKASGSGVRETIAGLMWSYTVMLCGLNLFLVLSPDLVLAIFFFLLLFAGGVFAGMAVFIGVITGMAKTPEFIPNVVLFVASCLMFAGNWMWLEVPTP